MYLYTEPEMENPGVGVRVYDFTLSPFQYDLRKKYNKVYKVKQIYDSTDIY